MPSKNFLKPEQISKLQQALRESESAHLRENILMLLLQNDGKTYEEIAQFIGCSPRTVAHWCVHGDPDNLETLRNKREQEHVSISDSSLSEASPRNHRKEPSDFGYEFGRWTGERLATYLAEQTGIKLSSSQIRRILKRKRYSYISAKYSLEERQDSEKRAEFTEKLQKYLAITKEDPEQLQVWFWKEVLRRVWSKPVGCRVKLRAGKLVG